MAEEPKNPAEGRAEAHAGEAQPAFDEASNSLAKALRTSFRVLTFLIVVLIGLFLLQGLFTVQPDQKAIVLRFGRTDESLVKDQGMHYAFPYPIDEVVRVWTRTRRLQVNTFWNKVTEEAKNQNVEKGTSAPQNVVGAEDAVLLTGDLNILQAQWEVTYHVKPDPGSVIAYYTMIGGKAEVGEEYKAAMAAGWTGEIPSEMNEERLVRTVLQAAAVRELAGKKVFDAYPTGQKELEEVVKKSVEESLNKLKCGIVVEQVNLRELRPPAQVKAAYDEVLAATQTAAQQRTNAQTERNKVLIDAAGAVGVELGNNIEQWWAAFNKYVALQNAPAEKPTDDRAQKEMPLREEMGRIETDRLELFKTAGGQVRTIIADAMAYKTTVVASAQADALTMQRLLGDSDSPTPEQLRRVKIFLDHAHVEALQTVLTNCYEKYFFKAGSGKERDQLELWLNRRPELLREMKKIEEFR